MDSYLRAFVHNQWLKLTR